MVPHGLRPRIRENTDLPGRDAESRAKGALSRSGEPSARASTLAFENRRFDAVLTHFDATDDAPVRSQAQCSSQIRCGCVVMTRPWRTSEEAQTQYSSQIRGYGRGSPLCVIKGTAAFLMLRLGLPGGRGLPI
jgi:hypothetical protein